MSMEEETELKDLVAQTLQSNGTLAKIKAQLRASIYLALDEDEKVSRQKPLHNNTIKTFMDTNEGKSMFYIVHDFLEFFDLVFTRAVYEPESYLDCTYQKEEKHRIAQQFGFSTETKEPLLYQLLKVAQTSKGNLAVTINVNGAVSEKNKSDSIYSEPESASIPENVFSGSNSEESSIEVPIEDTHLKISHNHNDIDENKHPTNLNSTFIKKHHSNTYNDTSSLMNDIDYTIEDTVPEIELNGLLSSKPISLLEELRQTNKTSNSNEKTVLPGRRDLEAKSLSKIISESNKTSPKDSGNSQKSKTFRETSEKNSIISENLEATSQ